MKRGVVLQFGTAKTLATGPKSIEASPKSVEAGPKSVEAGQNSSKSVIICNNTTQTQ